MELFFQNLGIEPDNSVNSVDKIELMAYNGNNDTADSVYKDNFDFVFMIDEINYSEMSFRLYVIKYMIHLKRFLILRQMLPFQYME